MKNSKEIIPNCSSDLSDLKYNFFKRIINITNQECYIKEWIKEGCVLKCVHKCSACLLEKQCRSMFGDHFPTLKKPETILLKKEHPEYFI